MTGWENLFDTLGREARADAEARRDRIGRMWQDLLDDLEVAGHVELHAEMASNPPFTAEVTPSALRSWDDANTEEAP